VSDTIISVVAALIRDPDGRVLLVRKRGTEAFNREESAMSAKVTSTRCRAKSPKS
jgi:hypothetical protein